MLTLTARSRLRILWPHGPLPEGLVSLPVDLAGFFRNAAEIGPDSALLLLTLRALRQRSFASEARVADLRWALGVSRRWIASQFQRLSGMGQLVYEGLDGAVVNVELTGALAPASLFGAEAEAPGVRHEIPTHWFTQHLPRLGRRAFLAYLFLRSLEPADVVPWLRARELGAAVGALGVVHAHLLVLRLRCFGFVRSRVHGLLVVDPPPIGPGARLFLRLLASGAIPATRLGRAAVVVVLLAPLGVLMLLR